MTKKHFLDTSVVRPLLMGTKQYKDYLQNEIGQGNLYISDFIRMELNRSYIREILNFYFLLHFPSIQTISEALEIWSNEFKSSKLKAVLQLISQLLSTRSLDFDSVDDKEKALRAIGQYVKRLELKIDKAFRNTGSNATRCTRSNIKLKYYPDSTLTESFRNFLKEFDDVADCRKKCRIDCFFFERHEKDLEEWTKFSKSISNPNDKENKGFLKIISKLNEQLEKKRSLSCKKCEAIGDATIALETPTEMQLVHTDYSFDHLCPAINKIHKRLSSERRFISKA